MSLNLWDFLVYIIIFSVIIFTDWRYHKIFNWNILVGIVFALFVGITSGHIVNSLLGAAVGFSLMVGTYILTRGQVGMGDIKLGLLIGLVMGFPLVFWVLAGTMIAGGLVAALITITKKPIKDLPLGVTMCVFALGLLTTTLA